MTNLEVLRELGLNQLEAEIYLFLLPQPPLTAYKVAKHLSKPTANVYKAIDVLARKGAVLLEDVASGQTCRAVPVKDFLHRAERSFQELAQKAATRLSKVASAPLEERVVRLDSLDQVVQFTRDMIKGATATLAIDATLSQLVTYMDELAAAARRGVAVQILTDEAATIPGATVTVIPAASRLVPPAHLQQLNLVRDGQESLTAIISVDNETLYQAFWTNSLYLAATLHAAQTNQQTILRALADGADPIAILKKHRPANHLGQRDLLARHAPPS